MSHFDRRERISPSGDAGVQPTVPGVIDTLGLGYAVLVARPVVMIPLLLIDLAVLLAPRVSFTPVARELNVLAAGRGEGWRQVRGISEWASGYNVVELLALQAPLIRMPAIVPSFSSESAASYGWFASFSALPSMVVAGLATVLIGIGLLISVVFRLLIASEGLGECPHGTVTNPRTIARMSLLLSGWLLAIAGLIALVAMPVLVVTALGMIFGFGGSLLLWLLMLIPIAWGFVHFHFSVHALFVDRIGPFDALRSSYLVVRANFWQSIQFIAVTMLITTGVMYALRQMSTSAGGVVAAVVINAFVATGIVVAAMLFYRDRARQLGLPVSAPER